LWGSYPPLDCSVEPGERPRRITARGGPTEEYPAELTLRGIYRLEGDVLTICFCTQDFPCPDEFRTADDLPCVMLELTRTGRKRK
jgi:uncharacterized protein (TIGR03067 family)